jgi:hypothetical protein
VGVVVDDPPHPEKPMPSGNISAIPASILGTRRRLSLGALRMPAAWLRGIGFVEE